MKKILVLVLILAVIAGLAGCILSNDKELTTYEVIELMVDEEYGEEFTYTIDSISDVEDLGGTRCIISIILEGDDSYEVVDQMIIYDDGENMYYANMQYMSEYLTENYLDC